MPTPADQSPAEQAIEQAHADRDAFFQQANDLFESTAQARTAALNPVAEAISAAGQKATGTLPGSDAKTGAASRPPAPGADTSRSSPPDQNASAAPAAIPGPPGKAKDGQDSPAEPPAPTQQGDSLEGEVPAPDAFDKGAARPQTAHWRALHAAKDRMERTYKTQLEAARKEVETLKTQAAGAGRDGVLPQEAQARLETLQKERDALLTRLEAVAVEKSPRFEAQFAPRKEAALMQAKAAVGSERAKKVEELMQLPESAFRDEQLEALLGELPPLRATKLTQAVADLDRLAIEKQQLTQRGSELFKQWQSEEQQQTQRQQQEREHAVRTTFESVVKEWQEAGAELDNDGVALARDVFMGQRELKDIATAAMWVAVGPRAVATAQQLRKELAEANERLQKLEKAQPGNANDAGSSLSAEEEVPQGLGYADAIIQAALKAGLPLR